MKKRGLVFVMAVMGMVSIGLTGCQKEEQASTEAVVEKTTDAVVEKTAEAPADAKPAAQKPMDHPAH